MKRIIPITPARRASGGEPAFRLAPPLGLYIHFPWCLRKCPYCDFNSHEVRDGIPEDDYVSALIADLESALPLVWGRRAQTVFMGGGTPSLLSPAAIEGLLTQVRMRLPLAPDAEITLEANPGAVEAGEFAAFRDAGITRLSLGIQSFDDAKLKALGRIHGGAEARRAAELAATHFANFNLDLMYGLPGQRLEEALHDVETAVSFSPPHLSCYQLTIEPHTRFAAVPPVLPEPDLCADMQEAIETCLAESGYDNYETSAFARPAQRCRHNLNYWLFGDYLGIGAGAHSKLTFHDGVRRQMRWREPRRYLAQVAAGSPVQQENAVTDLAFEFMMNALRLADGFTIATFEQRTGLPWSSLAAEVAAAIADGLLDRHGEQIAPTLRGRRFLNVLLRRFLPDAAG